jgi:D-3-phosphoglycerate dehydrogenase
VAGAAGHLLGVLDAERPSEFVMTVRGNLPDEAIEHVFVAALSEGLRRWTSARVTPVNARLIAQEQQLEARVAHADERSVPLAPGGATFSFETTADTQHSVTVRWEHSLAGIVEVDRFSLDRPLVGDVLITHHRDRPGLIGRVGMILGSYDVNVAGMQVGRHHRGGEALMVLSVDDAIPPAALLEILAIEDVNTAYVVSLPNPEAHNGARHEALAAVKG